jgi:Protein of unknown function (DUF3800)
MLVFVDESGDPGFKLERGSSAVFTAALVAFRDVEQARATHEAIDATAAQLRVRPEFKFSKCRPQVRDAFFETVHPFEFSVRAMVVQKSRVHSAHLRSDKEAFYSFFVTSMLNFDDGLLEAARVIIDGSGDRVFKREMGAYFRRHLGKGKVKSIQYSNSAGDRLIQLADMCAGAIGRSFKHDRSDRNRWRNMLGRKIEHVWEFP